jgi:hypothetical protein
VFPGSHSGEAAGLRTDGESGGGDIHEQPERDPEQHDGSNDPVHDRYEYADELVADL